MNQNYSFEGTVKKMFSYITHSSMIRNNGCRDGKTLGINMKKVSESN